MINLNDVEYSDGWAFFVSDCRDIDKLNLKSEAWALGWLAACADYSQSTSVQNAVYDYFGMVCVELGQFVKLCQLAVKNVRARGEFVRYPCRDSSLIRD